MMKNRQVFITCEHGGNNIPHVYHYLFKDAANVLATHRGYDIGALPVAIQLGEAFAYFQSYASVSRLLVDLNRSLGNRHLWSEFTRKLSKHEKSLILEQYYFSYRHGVEAAIKEVIANNNQVLHLSIHSFTPELNGQKRNAEIGLLYDPQRRLEKKLCLQWAAILEHIMPDWHIRRNYPYRGAADGFVTYLRKTFKPTKYVGVELEINQALMTQRDNKVADVLKQSLSILLEQRV
ncbi:MAG: N-formylglutamate amidohydrolase [Gammaproteobacteria bacterium]